MPVQKRILIVAIVIAAMGALLSLTREKTSEEGLKAGFDAEFLTRPDGYLGLSEKYGFKFPAEPRQMDPGLMYKAAADGAVDVIDAFATDGRIPAYDLLVLEDDRGFFPPYYAAPLIRLETLNTYPQLEDLLNNLGGKLDDESMQKLNYEVDEKGRKASEVAREFLLGKRLIAAEARIATDTEKSITIGSKHFTERSFWAR